MKYTKHPIQRIKDLNDDYFEVVFQKDSLVFVPGSSITLYKGPEIPVFIASGISEPWVRLILNRDLFWDYFVGCKSIRLDLGSENMFQTLMMDDHPNFVVTSECIGPFFSYVSTHPSIKCKVCYLGDNRISEEWIKSNHTLLSASKIAKCTNLYIMGNQEVIEKKARKLINNCKGSYLV